MTDTSAAFLVPALAARVAELEAALRSIIDLGGACGVGGFFEKGHLMPLKVTRGQAMTDTSDIGSAPQIPLIGALKVKVIGRAHNVMLPPLVQMMKWNEGPPETQSAPDDMEFSAFAQIGFEQTAPKGAAEVVRANAVRAICHHVYGPIERELHLVLEDMWRRGLSSYDPAVLRIERLIHILRTGGQP